MNLAEYLAHKKKLLATQTMVPTRTLCLKCLRSIKSCLCATLIPFTTKTHFVILMHPKEAKKEKVGTGRLSHILLNNSRIIIGENFDHNAEVLQLLSDCRFQHFILYPGKMAHHIDLAVHPQMHEAKKEHQKEYLIFIIDGTWSCAKSMMRDSTCLHQIPRLSFKESKQSRFQIKQQPAVNCISTIESLFYLIESLVRWKVEPLQHEHYQLLKTLDKICEFQHQCALLPNAHRYRPGVPKKKGPISQSKKWKSRRIYFETT